MSLEQSIDELNATMKTLTAAIEAATGVFVALGGASGKAAGTPPAASTPATRGRPKAAATPAPAPDAADEGFGDDGGLGGDDGGLGGDDTAGVTGEQAKAAVIAYRDKAVKLKGKEEGLNLTRSMMKKYVAALDDIDDSNASEIHKAFTSAITKLK